jgi:hypothetical protein
MQAINWKDICKDKCFLPIIKLIRRNPNAPYSTFTLSSFLGVVLLLICLLGCAPTSSTSTNLQNQSASASNDLPEITDEVIREEINDAYVREVPEENGAGEPISWRFGEDEPKEFTIVEKQSEGGRATIILDIKTSSSPRARTPRHLAGQIRTKWVLQTGWALRTWEIVETENISLKYKNLPKPAAQNPNR